jgi:hypothetical protein
LALLRVHVSGTRAKWIGFARFAPCCMALAPPTS